MLAHDIILTHFATPDRADACASRERSGLRIRPELLNEEQRTDIPLLSLLIGDVST